MRALWILPVVMLLGAAAWLALDMAQSFAARPADGLSTEMVSQQVARSKVDERETDGMAEIRTLIGPHPKGIESIDADGVPSRLIAGVVTDPDGKAVADAAVRLYRLQSPWPERRRQELQRGYTDAEGGFQFVERVGDDLLVEATHERFASAEHFVDAALRSIPLRLGHGFNIGGIVLGPSGRPEPGVEVVLEPGPLESRRYATTQTNDEGRFTFENVPGGAGGVVRLTARHPSFRPALLANVPVGSVGVQLQFAPLVAVSLRGGVRRVDGRPLTGAEVRVFAGVGWNAQLLAPYQTTTGADGEFAIAGLGPGNLLVIVRHPAASTTHRIVPIGPDSPSQAFELSERGVVAGRLDGVVPAGLELVLSTPFGESGRCLVGADGRFEFDGTFSTGGASLRVSGGKCAFSASSGREADLVIEEGDETEYRLTLTAPSRITGRVVDSDGRPIAGVVVETPRHRLQPHNPERWFATTDSDGSFEFTGFPVGLCELLFRHDRYALSRIAVDVPGAGQSTVVDDVVLERPGTISGRVIRGSQPVAGASVSAARSARDTLAAVTDRDGRFRLDNVAPGAYRVLARFSTLPIQVADGEVEVRSEKVTEGIDIVFPPARMVSGEVVDTSGAAVADALVFVAGLPAAPSVTDAAGHFSMEVPPVEVDLQVFSPDFQLRVDSRVAARQETVRAVLPWIPRGRLNGRVIGLPDRRPQQRVILRVTPLDLALDGDPDRLRQRTIAALQVETAGGRLMVESVPSGRSRIEIDAPGFAPFRTDIEVSKDETIDLGAIRLEPGAEVRGIVVDTDDRPIEGAYVHLGIPEDVRHPIARHDLTAADGSFRLRGATPGSRGLVVWAEGYSVQARELQFPDDFLRREPMRIQLPRASHLTVQVTKDGQAIESPQLIALLREGELYDVRPSDPEGHVEFLIVRSGSYRVGLFGAEAHGVVVEVDESGADRTAELELGRH